MIDLKSEFVSEVSYIVNQVIDSAELATLQRELSKYQKSWPARPIDTLGMYSIGDDRYHFDLTVAVLRRRRRLLLIRLEIHSVPRDERVTAARMRREIEAYNQIERILKTLGRMDLHLHAHGTIEWEFPEGTRKPIINLPMLALSDPNMPFSEISGVRLTKRLESKSISAIIDRLHDGSLRVSIHFVPKALISGRILREVLNEGSKILEQFVTRVKEVEE